MYFMYFVYFIYLYIYYCFFIHIYFCMYIYIYIYIYIYLFINNYMLLITSFSLEPMCLNSSIHCGIAARMRFSNRFHSESAAGVQCSTERRLNHSESAILHGTKFKPQRNIQYIYNMNNAIQTNTKR